MSSHLSPYLSVKELAYTLLLGRFTSAILTNRSFLVECTEKKPYGVIKGLASPPLGPDFARPLISHLMPLVAHFLCTSSFPPVRNSAFKFNLGSGFGTIFFTDNVLLMLFHHLLRLMNGCSIVAGSRNTNSGPCNKASSRREATVPRDILSLVYNYTASIRKKYTSYLSDLL